MLFKLLPIVRSVLANNKTTIPGIIVFLVGAVIFLSQDHLTGGGFMAAGAAHMLGMDADHLNKFLEALTCDKPSDPVQGKAKDGGAK